jgi:hypothetical protein
MLSTKVYNHLCINSQNIYKIDSGILTMVFKQCQKVQRTGQRDIGLFMKTIGLLRFLK